MRLGKTLLKFIFVLCFFAATGSANAQRYDLVIHNAETGLAGNQVNDIVQDASGVLWVATNNGVSSFDGIRFQNYTAKTGLAENLCTSIYCDTDGHIWVGHQSAGLSQILRDTILHFNEASGLSNNEVHGIIQTENGDIWVATFGGISIYDGKTWQTLSTADGLGFNNIQVLEAYEDGSIWAGSYGAGINIIAGSEIRQLHMGDGLVNNYVTSLMYHDGDMLVGTLGGLSKWDGAKFTTDMSTRGLFSNQINGLAMDEEHHLWLATFSGAVRVAGGQTMMLSESNGLPQNEVLDVFTDAESNIWMGTKAGLIRIRNLAFSHFESTDELDIYPSSLFVDSKNRLWTGNEAGGVLLFDGELFEQAFEDPDINDRQISAIAEDGDGNLWFGTMDFGGLFQWTGKQFYIYSDEFGLADNNINCLATDKEGILYIGTPNGLSTYDGTGFEVVYLSDDFATNHITALECFEDGRIAIGSKDGSLHIMNEGNVSRFQGFRPNSHITDICETNGGFCIATLDDGIWLSEGERTVAINKEHGLPGSGANVVFQSGNRLYASSAQAMVQIRVTPDTVLVLTINNTDGYVGGTAKSGASVRYDGVHFLGTEKGIARFDPAELRLNNHQPSTRITELQLSYETVNWRDLGFETDETGMPLHLELNHSNNNLRFIFRGIDHQKPEGVQYKWQLEGYEREWTPLSDQTQANYPNLPPGDYTFKLIACNGSGVCNSQETTFEFRIIPPFWQRLGFHISAAVVVVLLTFYFIKRRERILLEEKEVLEATVAERTKELRKQKEIVERQNEHITESIEYASNIQRAILPSEFEMKRAFRDHFVFYRPKDTVGGDLYWVYSKGDISWAAAVDCTGHGVAGAFMSMIGSDLLNQIIIEKHVQDPAEVLNEMDKGIKLAFAQSAKEFETDQGMDMALVRIDRKNHTVEFAGAQRPLFYVEDGELKELEGNRLSISCAVQRNAEPFTKQTVEAKEGTVLYLFSDGIVDQFGGPKQKKFMVRRMREFITNHHKKTMSAQLVSVSETFDDWKGPDNVQIDDVMLLGIQI